MKACNVNCRCLVSYGTLLSNHKPSEAAKFLAKNIYFLTLCKYYAYM
jgi:hypothetical protein